MAAQEEQQTSRQIEDLEQENRRLRALLEDLFRRKQIIADGGDLLEICERICQLTIRTGIDETGCLDVARNLTTDGAPSVEAEAARGPRAAWDLTAMERQIIVDALKHSRGNATVAARQLGITPRMVRYRMKKFNMDWRAFRGSRQPD